MGRIINFSSRKIKKETNDGEQNQLKKSLEDSTQELTNIEIFSYEVAHLSTILTKEIRNLQQYIADWLSGPLFEEETLKEKIKIKKLVAILERLDNVEESVILEMDAQQMDCLAEIISGELQHMNNEETDEYIIAYFRTLAQIDDRIGKIY